jgi:hypothetical protein
MAISRSDALGDIGNWRYRQPGYDVAVVDSAISKTVKQVSAQCFIPTGFVAHFLNPKGRGFRLVAAIPSSA